MGIIYTRFATTVLAHRLLPKRYILPSHHKDRTIS